MDSKNIDTDFSVEQPIAKKEFCDSCKTEAGYTLESGQFMFCKKCAHMDVCMSWNCLSYREHVEYAWIIVSNNPCGECPVCYSYDLHN